MEHVAQIPSVCRLAWKAAQEVSSESSAVLLFSITSLALSNHWYSSLVCWLMPSLESDSSLVSGTSETLILLATGLTSV